jgi:hypothetical protein
MTREEKCIYKFKSIRKSDLIEDLMKAHATEVVKVMHNETMDANLEVGFL